MSSSVSHLANSSSPHQQHSIKSTSASSSSLAPAPPPRTHSVVRPKVCPPPPPTLPPVNQSGVSNHNSHISAINPTNVNSRATTTTITTNTITNNHIIQTNQQLQQYNASDTFLSRFEHLFKSTHNLPPPPLFTNKPKTYPSQKNR